MIPRAGIAALRAFGAQAERLEYPYIDVGGFIVPGRDPVAINPPGKETERHAAAERAGPEGWEQSAPEQAGPPAGARQRSAEAAPGASPHALGDRLTTLNLDLPALVSFHPLTRVVASGGAVVHLNIPLGIIPELPIGARLTLEVPVTRPERTIGHRSDVPDVRAWAVWEGGIIHGRHIVSHHRYPDEAICASMAGQWMLGVHPLHDYVAFCALWVAKALHEMLLGSYPGPQHCSAAVRMQRDRPDEFCGCSEHRRYRDCCRDADLANGPFALWQDANASRLQYLTDLARQGRSPGRPESLLTLGTL